MKTNPWTQIVGACLQERWPEVLILESDACERIVDEFVSRFLRPDLQKRFRTRAFCREGITPRFIAGSFAVLHQRDDMHVATAQSRTPVRTVAADIVWGAQGFHVEGPPRSFRDLLVDEGDAVVRLVAGRTERWLFWLHDSDDVWLMKGTKELPGGD